jgi:glucose/arabinose dehydrogenase
MRTTHATTIAAMTTILGPLLFAGGVLPRVAAQMPATVTSSSGDVLALRSVVTGLDTIWDMVWAPDGEMWITERGGRVSRIDVATGEIVAVGELEVREQGESGLMGMAFHPDFPEEPWVYFAYSYDAGGQIRNRLARARFENGRLGDPISLVDDFEGRGNHNGARIVFGPDGLLYMTMGEAGQRPLSQDPGSLNGKILRLTPEGRPAPGNPFGSAVWSLGHRNPQGLVFQPATGVLYSSEHGPNSDDENNVIEPGRNYGWPTVAGFCDSSQEQAFCDENDVSEPVHSWTPTVGIAGIDFYDHDLIPGWRGNLLAAALGGRSLFRLSLSGDGRTASGVERLFQNQLGRLRDVLAGPDGAVYIATSNLDGRGQTNAGDDQIIRLTPAD